MIPRLFVLNILLHIILGAIETSVSGACDSNKSVEFWLARDTGVCLDIKGGKAVDGSEVIIDQCKQDSTHKFIYCTDGRIVSSQNTSMCLDIPTGDPKQVQNLRIWQCNGGQGQYWHYDTSTQAIVPASTGEFMCMDVHGGSTQPGTNVLIYYCNPGTGERWVFGPVAPTPIPACSGGTAGYFQLDRDPTKCIDITGGQAVNGAQLQIEGCSGAANQKFMWCSDGRIVSAMNDKMCMDIAGGDVSKVSSLEIWSCAGVAGQYWNFDRANQAIYPAQVGEKMCVDVHDGSTDPGTAVILYNCDPGTGEKWLTFPAKFVSV